MKDSTAPATDASDVIFTYMNAWDYIRLNKLVRVENLRQYIEWPRVPAEVQAGTLSWHERAIAFNREMLLKDPEHADITVNMISNFETILELFRNRSKLNATADELYCEYEMQRMEYPEEPEVMIDAWPENLAEWRCPADAELLSKIVTA